MGRYMIEENDAEQFVSCVYSPYFVVIACILTVYQSINAKKKSSCFVSKHEDLVGGEGGIRTLETFLTPTRFPVVRPRPG